MTAVKVPDILESGLVITGSDVETIVKEWVEARGFTLAKRGRVALNDHIVKAQPSDDNRTLAMLVESIELSIIVAPVYRCPACHSRDPRVHAAECGR